MLTSLSVPQFSESQYVHCNQSYVTDSNVSGVVIRFYVLLVGKLFKYIVRSMNILNADVFSMQIFILSF